MGLHTALSSLYSENTLTLTANKNPLFDKGVFDKMVQWLHTKKGFSAKMLAEKPAQDVINETNRILAKPISVQQDIPIELTTALEENTYIFSGFKSFHQMQEVSSMLRTEDGGIKPFGTFKQEVQKIHAQYNERYLQAEYNFATHSVQAAVKWRDFEKDGDRYNLQYRTANDGNVREEHQSLHNTTLPPNDPFWGSYYPPNGWNCRCTAVQVRKEKYTESNSNEAIALGDASTSSPKMKIFRFNAGKEMKVFPPKHPYLPKNCNGCGVNSIGLAFGKGRPECEACKVIQKSATATERNRYLNAMKPLLSQKIDKQVSIDNQKKNINIGFTARGNKHLYSDTMGRVKGKFSKEELSTINKNLEKAKFVKHADLSKKRKDEITRFYYFKDAHAELYYNVAEKELVRKEGKVDRERFLYSITSNIK